MKKRFLSLVVLVFFLETHYSYTPSDARATRALCGGEVRAERALRDCGTHEAL